MLTAGRPTGTPVAAGVQDPPRRARWWGEIVLGLAVFGVYVVANALPLPGHRARAIANGENLLALERALGLDFELVTNHWLAGQGWLRVAANYEYAFTYVVTSFVLLFWLYARRPREYGWARNSFVALNLVAIACFWLYPVAPPRLLPGAGFVDTVAQGRTWGSWGSPMVDGANQLAAMPSLHIAWALWVSVVLARIAGGWAVQLASAGHVLLTFAVIVATGNHYWIDAVGGAVVVWFGVAVTGRRAAGTARSRLTPVADTETETPSTNAPTARQLAAARSFVAAHGKPSKAVVERIGRAGARVVLVGADGAMGDVTVADVESGDALVAAVDDLEPATWDAETVGATVIGPAHRRKMAGPRARA